MANYNSIIVTSAGAELLNGAISSGGKLTFTKAQATQTQYFQEQIKALTGLSPVAQETQNLTISSADSSQTKVSIVFTNTGLKTGYNANGIGLYVSNETDETLFAVATAKNAEVVPAYDGTQAQSMVIDFYLALNAKNATVNIENAGMVSGTQLADVQSKLSQSVDTVDKNAVHLAGSETISGDKNFTGKLQKGGVDVATKNDNVASSTKLATPRTINGTNFDGTADISVKASNDSDLVHKSSAETVSGDKNFTGKLQKGGIDVATANDVANAVSNNSLVHRTGDETIAGDKMFNGNNTFLQPINGKFSNKILSTGTDLYTLIEPGFNYISQTTTSTSTLKNVPNGVKLAFGIRTYDISGYNNNSWAGTKLVLTECLTGNTFFALLARDNQNVITVQKTWQKIVTDSTVVHNTGNENVSGAKIFSDLLTAKSGIIGNVTGSLTGNATQADKLTTARKINGTSFDGTADININANNDSDLVHKSGSETVIGDKNFTGALQKSGVNVATVTDAANAQNNAISSAKNYTDNSLSTRTATFTKFADVAKDMEFYAGKWANRETPITDSPTTQIWLLITVTVGGDDGCGSITLVNYPNQEFWVTSVDWGVIKGWHKLATIDDVLSRQYVKLDPNGKPIVGDKYVVLASAPNTPSITIDESANYTIAPSFNMNNDVIAPIDKYTIYYKINNVDYSQVIGLDSLTGRLSTGNLPTADGVYPLAYSVTATNIYAESKKSDVQTVNYTPKDNNIYGVSWNLGSDPTLTRTDASVGLVAGINGARNDFDSKSVWKQITQVTDGLGNAFIRVPKVYIRKTQTSSQATWQVSLSSHGSDWYLPACFYNFANSKELDYVDISAYEGSVVNGKLQSVSGVAPTTSLSIVDFRKNAVANGNGYQLWDVHVNDLLQVLFIVEFATLNSQSIMAGATSNGAAINTGSANGHKGSSGTGTSGAMSYRGVENVYGNIWKCCDGVNFTNNTAYVCKDSSKYKSDLFASPYSKIGYLLASGSGDVSSRGLDSTLPFAQFSTALNGSDSAYYTDYTYTSISNTVLYTGGGWDNGAYAGLFFLYWSYSSAGVNSIIGSRLIKKAS